MTKQIVETWWSDFPESLDYFLFFNLLLTLMFKIFIFLWRQTAGLAIFLLHKPTRPMQQRNSNPCERPKLFSFSLLHCCMTALSLDFKRFRHSWPRGVAEKECESFHRVTTSGAFVCFTSPRCSYLFIPLCLRVRREDETGVDAAPLWWEGCIRSQLFPPRPKCWIWVNAARAWQEEHNRVW